ncbi:Rhomboid-like protein 15 [Orchesella cincta]|uniref:Rhomboid-like protein 15 n=1 Tax=Orchesella cincta TaxID=48709 RepID=A0A1D2NM18_ORCCI|nr:Rhomboid-like protein 15 [Orchesella cincta]
MTVNQNEASSQCLDQNGNPASTVTSSASTFANHNRPTLNPVLLETSHRSSRSNTNFHYHFRDASTVITEQPPSNENVRRRRYLMESRAALYLPPVATSICALLISLYFFREYVHVFGEADIYVSWNKIFKEKQIWRLFVAQFFHFSRVSVVISMFTLYAIGRYLERKVTTVAMLSVIMVMSVLSHVLYIFLNPYFCVGEQTEFVWGFGNVVYSLRVMLAYALEPRNHERDLVFGLYPMVLSANAAPWQPVLHCHIYLASVATEGIYIANPPYFWVPDPEPENPNNDERNGGRWRKWSSTSWKMETYPSRDFFVSPPSDTALDSQTLEAEPTRVNNELIRTNANALKRNSDELKRKISKFLVTAKESLVRKLGKGANKDGKERSENCKLLHKRRRKKSRKSIVIKLQPPPCSTISERSSGSVSSFDPDCLTGDLTFASDMLIEPASAFT